jgi:hypothetical protein
LEAYLNISIRFACFSDKFFSVTTKTSGLGIFSSQARFSGFLNYQMWNWININFAVHVQYAMVLFWIDIKVLNLMLPCFQNVIILFFINSEIKEYNSIFRILFCPVCVISQPYSIDGYFMNLI